MIAGRPAPSLRPTLARAAFWAALAVVAVLLLLPGNELPETNVSDKLEHAFVFTVLAFLGCRAFPGRRGGSAVAVWLCVFGAACEVAQAWIPGRSASFLDAAADALGVILGCALFAALRRVMR